MKAQEPVRPFPYIESEIEFHSYLDSTILHGTVTYPSHIGKFPAVVLVSGSGAHNRDEEILGHKPFLVISDYLTKSGIAVLRYDDRHYKMPIEERGKFTTLDFAKDTNGAINYLKGCDFIDSDSIGICGHSEGGVIAAIVASERSDLSYIISLAGPSQDGFEILKYQSVALAKDARAQEYGIKLLELVKNEPEYQKREVLGRNLIRSYSKWFEFKSRSIAKRNLPYAISNWIFTFLNLSPKLYWEKVRCSVLAIFGEYDIQVLAAENQSEMHSALIKCGNIDFELVTIPKVNHFFQTVPLRATTDYQSILNECENCKETISPKVLELIKSFIIKRHQKFAEKPINNQSLS